MDNWDVLIIGGGASGLAAGVEAARAGARTLILEKNHVPGRKVLSTGAGKCNFSNSAVSPSRYHPPSAAFLRKTFKALPPAAVLQFFDGLGLLYSEDDRGRFFPRSQKAQDVVNALAYEFAAKGGRLLTLCEAAAVAPAPGGFSVEAYKVPPQWDKKSARGERLQFASAKVILAAGGPCYPQIGGSSSGAALLRSLGHSVSPFSPVLAPLRSGEAFLKELDGVRLEAALALTQGGLPVAESRGEILFASYGLSGPAALDLCRAAGEALREEGELFVEADLFPDYRLDKLARLLSERADRLQGRPFRHFACGLHNEKLLKAACARAGFAWEAPLPDGAAPELAALLKNFSLSVKGVLGFEDAMVSAGGCSLAEVQPGNFASKAVPGLFVTGELLDLDGDSGGFNLHLAWTSGILAGRAAAAK